MKILQIAPLWESVPPPAYGGTEAVVHLLVEELVRQGHEVTLWASGDSRTSAVLRYCYPRSLRTDDTVQAKHLYAWQHAALAMRDAREFDIIHNHAGEDVMALAHLVPDVPMLTTTHCNITPDSRFVWDRYPGYYNHISWAQRRITPPSRSGKFIGVVYNGIDVPSFPFQEKKEDYLLFLSRISEEKGPHLAVEVARRTGRRLIIAGKVDKVDREFFEKTMVPLIDGDGVCFLGEADASLKRELYRSAYAVVLPIMWEEPFGLVMAESLACGTPVVTFNRGAAPEVVKHCETGFVVEDIDQMVEAISYVPDIDPRACRRHVELHFDGPVMAANYLAVYETILGKERRVAPAAELAPLFTPGDAASSAQVA